MKDLRNHSLLRHNTFGIEASCRRFVEYESVDDARRLACMLTDDDLPLLIIGGGSNLLLTGDFNGTVLHSAIKGKELLPTDEDSQEAVELRCGSGEVWDEVVDYCVSKNWYGMENLSLIPGEVGASAVQNIGAYGSEVKDLIVKVEAVELGTGRVVEFSNAECEYAYRQSKFKHEWKNRFLITHVTYRLATGAYRPLLDYGNIRAELKRKAVENPTAKMLRQTIIDIRNAKLPDPNVEGNAGSFFMNPIVSREKYEELVAQYPEMPHYTIDDRREKIPAGWMIDLCGWKGKSLGRAGVHSKQALVLVNRGGATGQDIVDLCETIRKDVWNRFGIDIHPEVNVV
ncbi:MAG: UDP-N-acetylmuramate dehydrogenase [Prevotella sp.]|nr:UDP-N-acetylmuramate dehydrogenase [Prevotella sp.]